MTDNYKDILLKYLTGNITKGSKSGILNYENLTTQENTSIDFGSNFGVGGYIQCKNSDGKENGKTLVYGNTDVNNIYTGYLALFEGINLIYYTQNYNTGTEFGYFKTLETDENGNIYGIDYYNDKFRFILLNNVSELDSNGNQQIILRNSYYLQGEIANVDTYYSYYFIKKSPQSASYMIVANNQNYGNYNLKGCLLKINVGAANEWIQFTTNISVSQYLFFTLGSYIYFDIEDNPHFEIYGIEQSAGQQPYNMYVYKNINTNIDQKELIYQDLGATYFNGGDISGSSKLLATGVGEYYLFLDGALLTSNYQKTKCLIIKRQNGIDNICFLKEGTQTYEYAPVCVSYMALIGIVPVIYIGFPINANEMYIATEEEQYIGIIPNPDEENQYIKKLPNAYYFPSQTGERKQPIIVVSNAYNMFNFGAIYYDENDTQKTSVWKIVYNPNNYNYLPYENINSLVANNGLIFDNNNNLVFARNLYNYKVYNNKTISVLNIPNSFLNNISLQKTSILSETNTSLFENTNSIIKNIYEELFINFFLTMKMVNNNTDTPINNSSGAIRINQSVSKIKDYDNAKATKIRKNFSDGSTQITGVSPIITNGVATYHIYLYVPTDKNIESIDIISEDENTIYQTIKNLNLTNNKYYHITQDVYVE